MKTHKISDKKLSLKEIDKIISEGQRLELSATALQKIKKCRLFLDEKIKHQEAPVYGVTTGFGSLCNTTISEQDLGKLQENLMMSHACGIGDEVQEEIVRLMLLLKVQSLSYGHSGVQVETVQRLMDFFNEGVCPVVYEQGSLGASGDLVPLAHLCLPIIGMGNVKYKGKYYSGKEINEKMGWKPVALKSKEGLALLNGTQFMSAHAVYCLLKAERLSQTADFLGSLSLDAFDGRVDPFNPLIHQVRPHMGQQETARNILYWTEGSKIMQQPKKHVQDPYSFRCIPQVHGAVKDTLSYVKSVVDIEINATTDNPTVCPDEDLIISAGNFHGEPIALPMDFLSIAMNELGSISERRQYKLVSGTRDLPSFLVAEPGVNSGFMIPQYTSASIVSQSKTLCMPSSADSIPTSQGQEDHVSMGANAGTKLLRIVQNTERVLAIELLTAAQALDFRRPLQSSPVIERVHHAFRQVVPFIDHDQVMYPHIAHAVEFIKHYVSEYEK